MRFINASSFESSDERCNQGVVVSVPSERNINYEINGGETVLSAKTIGTIVSFVFTIFSELDLAENQAIFAVNFFDRFGSRVDSDCHASFCYATSERYGRYKYLSATCEGISYKFSLTIPQTAESWVLTISGRNGHSIKLSRMPDIYFFNRPASHLIVSLDGIIRESCIFDKIYAQFDFKHLISVIPLLFNRALNLNDNESFRASYLWFIWYVSRDPAVLNLAKSCLFSQGRLYDSRRILNQYDALLGYRRTEPVSKRVDTEILLLERGFSFPAKIENVSYQPLPVCLYLLHNRLPYNSGGYAMRTHGLLTGIQDGSDYRMVGVSRPGYPSDHVAHISKPLPTVIPKVDRIDHVDYVALDQSFRRSQYTFTEYISRYADDVAAEAMQRRAAIIHAAANFPNGLAAAVAARKLGIKSVYEVRGLWEITRMSRQPGWQYTDYFKYMAKMEAEACHAVDAVITITEALKELMVQRGVDESKITVVPNCVHVELFSPQQKCIELAAELGITEDDIVIGYIGSVVNYEGLDDLLEAVALLVAQHITNIKLLIVGDGAVLNELKQQVDRLSLSQFVLITGRVPHDEVQKYYSLVDITPFPRKPYLVCEVVSPLKPFEAMASEKAVIVSSCAALTEIIKHGETGLVFEKGNIASLVYMLKELITNSNLRNTLARNGREWVIRERDWTHSASKVVTLYDSLLKNATPEG